MQKQIHECIDGRCPVGIDSVREISLSSKEKMAIFVYLKREIGKLKKVKTALSEKSSAV